MSTNICLIETGAKRVAKVSEKYIVANLEDDESEGYPELEPEGAGYIPRIIFFDMNGEPRYDIKNPSQYAYFYGTTDAIADKMELSYGLLTKHAVPNDSAINENADAPKETAVVEERKSEEL